MKWKTVVLDLVVTGCIVGGSIGAVNASVSSPSCWVDNQEISAAQCQEWADAAWEGLGMEQQAEVVASGLKGTRLDQLVIDTRSGNRVDEDEASWDCATMGNLLCGVDAMILPHTH